MKIFVIAALVILALTYVEVSILLAYLSHFLLSPSLIMLIVQQAQAGRSARGIVNYNLQKCVLIVQLFYSKHIESIRQPTIGK